MIKHYCDVCGEPALKIENIRAALANPEAGRRTRRICADVTLRYGYYTDSLGIGLLDDAPPDLCEKHALELLAGISMQIAVPCENASDSGFRNSPPISKGASEDRGWTRGIGP